MAMRGTPARRIVGNPLGGVLRSLDQRARIAGRTRASSGPREEDSTPYEEPPRATAGTASVRLAATVVVTGEDGRARWTFPTAYGAPPAMSAVAVDPALDADDRTVLVTLEEVTAWCAVVRVWRTRGRRGHGVAEPAGPNVRVHVMAAEISAGYATAR